MGSAYFINLIFISALTILFFCSGILLNTLILLSFWKSAHLRKKTFHFMIMVISCCDLLVVVSNNPLIAVGCILWLTGKLTLDSKWIFISLKMTNIPIAASLFALLVMSLDRYLATYYPVFHRTRVTKRRLLMLLSMIILFSITLGVLSINHIVFSHPFYILIIFLLFVPPMFFFNCKLFLVARKNSRNNAISPENSAKRSSKIISTCLLVVICNAMLSIPAFVYIALRITSRYKSWIYDVDNAYFFGFWAKTIASMNCTFNCLIFYWKNKIFRAEGWKVLKSMRIYRWIRPNDPLKT